MAPLHGYTRLLFALFFLSFARDVAASSDDDSGPFQFLENRYNSLDDKGKFAASAAIGFVGTRFAMKTAMGVLKFGAAAFIT